MVVVVRRPVWLGWALGHTRTERLTLQTPLPRLTARWVTVAPHEPVRLRFDEPVDRVAYEVGAGRHVVSGAGRRIVSLGQQATSGTATVAAAARAWERPGAPTPVTWFPAAKLPVVLVEPCDVTSDLSALADPADLLAASERGGRHRPASVLRRTYAGAWRTATATRSPSPRRALAIPSTARLRLELPRSVAVASGEPTATAGSTIEWHVAGRELPPPAAAPRRWPATCRCLAAARREPCRARAARRARRGRQPAGRHVSPGATRTRRPSCSASGRPDSRTRSPAAP